jgi:cell division protein FtsL
MNKFESLKKFKFIFIQFVIIAPIFFALLVYYRHVLDVNSSKREFKKLVEIEEELYTQHEFLLLEKAMLSSPARIEKIAINKLGFVCPDSISYENENKMNLTTAGNNKR